MNTTTTCLLCKLHLSSFGLIAVAFFERLLFWIPLQHVYYACFACRPLDYADDEIWEIDVVNVMFADKGTLIKQTIVKLRLPTKQKKTIKNEKNLDIKSILNSLIADLYQSYMGVIWFRQGIRRWVMRVGDAITLRYQVAPKCKCKQQLRFSSLSR